MNKRIYILQFVICLACLVNAQQIKLPYQCGFEETENLSDWNIVNPTGATDCWMFGTAAHSEGKRSLYISNDGKAATFGNKPNISVAYLRVKFPTETKQKNYDFSFDWRCEGVANNSMLYVMCCPEQFFTQKTSGAEGYYLYDIVSSTKGILPNATIKVCEKLGPNSLDALNGSSTWQNVSLTNDIRISSKNSQLTWVIAFIWVNNNTDANVTGVGACIDNIQIASATIRKPTDLTVTPVCDDSTMHVTWESASNYFVVEYRKVGTSTWRRSDGLTEGVEFFEKNGTSCSYDLQRILEGTYDVRVKSALIGGTMNDTSAYAQVNSILMFCPYNHCINYLDLDNPYLTCTYGFTTQGGNKGTPYDNIGYIYVPDDLDVSRHTIMTDPTAVDPETDSLLLCVPPGEIGSVRLGNAKSSYEAESMTYTFSVDSLNAAILLVKYACVLNKPNTSCGDPGFKMEIFDEQDNPIENLCGVPNFSYSSAAAAGWEETKDGSVVWKDWTTVGINLQQYSGQNLKVRFTTEDCGGGGHFGYAYFTLDCASAYIETENCGNDAQIVCEAPEGFAYQWRDENGTIVCNEKTLQVDAGQHTYTCRVSFIEDPTCYFEVSTTSAPRFPVPAFTTTWIPENCYNRVRFTNHSHVMNKYGGFENHTSETCLDQHWYFTSLTDGSTTETTNYGPLYVAREEGDSILVRLTTYIGENNVCDSTLDTIIYVPSIHSRDSIVNMELCEGSPFLFDGEAVMAEKDSVYQKTYTNFAGCDSVFTLNLIVHPNTPEVFLRDTSCSTERYKWNGMYCDSTGHYEAFFQNKWGCDSIVNLDLLITDILNVQVDSVPYLCADGEELILNFQVYQGVFDSLTIQFDENAQEAGFQNLTITDNSITSAVYPYPADIKPDLYVATLTFYQPASCGNTVFNLPFELRYATSILEQRWNDVIGIRNAEYNGGYEFSDYQWFKDGEMIAGATLPYLYTPEGLDPNADYYVRLTRSSDGAVIYTCPITPDVVVGVNDLPTLVRPEQKMKVQGKGVARWIDTLGNIVYTQNYDAESGIIVPSVSGYHTLSMVPEDAPSSARIILVQPN